VVQNSVNKRLTKVLLQKTKENKTKENKTKENKTKENKRKQAILAKKGCLTEQ
jgi:hypothetical protein